MLETDVNRNKGQVLTEHQLKQIAKDAFNMIDMRQCGTLSKGELRELVFFVKDSLYMHNTKYSHDKNTGITSTDFDEKSFEALYD